MEKGSRHGAVICCGQAAMVHADHVNSWWGVELLIPLLKHTKYYYFCELSMCRPMPTRGKCDQIGMHVFAFGKLVCKYFPKYLRLAQELAIKEASVILGRPVKCDILLPSEKTGELPSVGRKIKCGDMELQHVCIADKFMSLDHHARLDGAIAFVCKDLLADKPVTYFQSLSSRYGKYSESEFWELKMDLWANQSDEYKLKWSEDRKKWWGDQSDEYKLEWSEDGKRRWNERSDEYKLEKSEDRKQRVHDLQKLSSGPTEEGTYYAVDGANEDGTYILIT
jgi:hypothetical protein